jgi:hypothetical protein
LIHFRVDNNQLTGPLPKSYGVLSQLRSLNFEENKLTGEIPHEWRTLQRLRSLKLLNNNMCDDDDEKLKEAAAWAKEKLHPKCISEVRIPLANER